MKKLPIGVQDFQQIIEDDYFYADKTDLIYELITDGLSYFLSRPRRFGKSLLLRTIESLFTGPVDPDNPKGLFADLKIAQTKWDFTQKSPTLYLDLAVKSDSPQVLENILKAKLNARADLENETAPTKTRIKFNATYSGGMLESLIADLARKYNSRVVLLIDEYDAPVSDHIDDLDLAKANQAVLKSFYTRLKPSERYLRLTLITGATRYAIGLSATLNHLVDLTFDKKYAAICGFTHEELDSLFGERMALVLPKIIEKGFLPSNSTVENLREKILKWYDGYTWDGETAVLNPWSILNFFDQASFEKYWVNSYPSTSFIHKLYRNDPFELLKTRFRHHSHSALGWPEFDELKPTPLLFQTGYLTGDEIFAGYLSLKVPNMEVELNNYNVFSDLFFNLLGQKPEKVIKDFKEAILSSNAVKLTEIFNSLYTGLAAINQEDTESFQHSVLYGYCRLLALTLSDPPGSSGAPFLVLFFPDDQTVAIIELKYESQAPESEEKLAAKLEELADKGLKAIAEKKYSLPYVSEAKNLVKIGLGVTSRGQCLAKIGDNFLAPVAYSRVIEV
ncbi:MAG: ATP-binding protein [Deltaproteobacteria bacterium]|nr:ATP-binding protein [Deltaproteobacteria bacterium]